MVYSSPMKFDCRAYLDTRTRSRAHTTIHIIESTYEPSVNSGPVIGPHFVCEIV